MFKDHRFLKLYKVLESEVIKFFYKFSTSELPKSGFSQFNLVHVVHTCKTRNNLLIYISRMSTLKYGNHFLRGVMVLLYGTNSFKIFFQAMIWCPSSNLRKLIVNFFSSESSFMKCSPATKSSNYLYGYGRIYILYVLVRIHMFTMVSINCFSVCACSYLYIFLRINLVLIGDSLDWIFYFKVPYHCIVIYIGLFICTEKFVYWCDENIYIILILI